MIRASRWLWHGNNVKNALKLHIMSFLDYESTNRQSDVALYTKVLNLEQQMVSHSDCGETNFSRLWKDNIRVSVSTLFTDGFFPSVNDVSVNAHNIISQLWTIVSCTQQTDKQKVMGLPMNEDSYIMPT